MERPPVAEQAAAVFSAIVVATGLHGQRGKVRLLGLSVLERIVFNLRHQGCTAITILTDPGPDDALATYATDRARWPATVCARSASELDVVLAEALGHDRSYVLWVNGDTVYHPGLPKLLLEEAAGAGSAVTVAAGQGSDVLLLRGGAEGIPAPPRENSAAQLVDTLLASCAPPPRRLDGAPAERFAIQIDTQARQAAATSALLRLNWRPHDGLVARLINKHLSVRFSVQLAKTSLTPNQMTVLAAIIGLVGVGLTALGHYWSFVVGAALMQIQSVLDGCDGELSRMRYQMSRLGAWLDTAVDDLLGVTWVSTIGIGLYRYTGHAALLWVGLAAGLMHLLGSGTVYVILARVGGQGHHDFVWWYEERKHASDDGKGAHAASGAGGPGFLAYLIRRDFYVLLFLLLALCNVMWLALAFASIGAASLFITSLLHVCKRGFTTLAHTP